MHPTSKARSRASIITALIAASLACGASAGARAVDLQTHHEFRIPAQSLDTALLAFSDQAKVQVLMWAGAKSDARSAGATGELSALAALKSILDHTGFSFQQIDGETVAIVKVGAPADTPSSTRDSPAGPTSWRVAQAGVPPNPAQDQSVSALPESSPGADSTAKNAKSAAVEAATVVVTATPELLSGNSLNADAPRSRDAVQPYVIFDHQSIVDSGAPDLDSFFRQRLPMSTGGGAPNQSTGGRDSRSLVKLRGLPFDQTLILVDGRRLPASTSEGATQQPDINTIPLAAIERIEVLPTTSSGIYGGGATGGVVNVILRRNYRGTDITVTHENGFAGGAPSYRGQLTGGFSPNQGKTNVMFAAGYTRQDVFLTGDRDYLDRSRALILARNPSAIFGVPTPPLGATTNIRATDGSNLVLKNGTALNSSVTFVPAGYTDSDGGAAFLTNAGQYNLRGAPTAQTGGYGQSILGNIDTYFGNASVRHEIDYMSLYVEVSGYGTRTRDLYSGLTGTFSVPAAAPDNPFLQAVTVTTPIRGVYSETKSDQSSWRVTSGATVNLGHDWKAGADLTWGLTRYSFSDADALNADASQAVASGAIDVFRDTQPSFAPYAVSGGGLLPSNSRSTDVTARISGPAISLPAGAVTTTFVAGYERDSSDDDLRVLPLNSPAALFPSTSQRRANVYGEMIVPLVGAEMNVRGMRLLEAQISTRYDNYETSSATAISIVNGVPGGLINRVYNRVHAVDPTIGLRYRPVRDVMLRGSYSTGFVAPNVAALGPNLPTNIPAGFFRDPLRGNELTPALVLYTGGNPNLKPETARTWTAGWVFEPAFLADFRASVDWVYIHKANNIAPPSGIRSGLEFLLANFPSRITRAAPVAGDAYAVGKITALDLTRANLAEVEVQSLDFALDYGTAVANIGRFDFDVAATRNLSFNQKGVPTAPFVNMVGTELLRKWRASATLLWSNGPIKVGGTVRYTDAALHTATGAPDLFGYATTPSLTYLDLFANYHFKAAYVPRGMELELGVRNVFNTKAPLADSTPYYSDSGDARNASYYLTVRTSF